MKSFTKSAPKSARDIAYYQQRYRNRVYSKLVSWISEHAINNQLTKKDIAEILHKDPAQITRLLSQPSNLTLDTIAELALAFDAEPEPPEFVFFKDRARPNYVHPLIARIFAAPAAPAPAKPSNTGTGELTVTNPDRPKIELVSTVA